MFDDLSRQLRRLMNEASRVNAGQSSRVAPESNVIRLRNVTHAASSRQSVEWRSRLLMKRGARMHTTCVERGDECAIAILDHCGVVLAWHDSLPGATDLAFGIIGVHMSQFYLPQDVALLGPGRSLVAAGLHGSDTRSGWRRRPDGSIFWGVTVIEAIHLNGGALYGYSHVTRLGQEPRVRVAADVRGAPRQYSTFHGATAAA